MKFNDAQRAELTSIKDAVRNLKKLEYVDFVTTLSSRQIAPRLSLMEDDEGFCMDYKCMKTREGVRVLCRSKFKIAAVYPVGITTDR